MRRHCHCSVASALRDGGGQLAGRQEMPNRSTFLQPLKEDPHKAYALVNENRRELVAGHVEPAVDSATRRRGLLGRTGLDPQTALIIAPSNAIHTFGMKFPIDVVFVSRAGRVMKKKTAVPRGRIALSLRAYATIELQANHPAVATLKVGDQLRLQARLTSNQDRHP
jgi:uncharacterized membrane protein (UPF0127 family)